MTSSNLPHGLAARILYFDMAKLVFEKLTLEAMASGHLCIRLSEKIGWEEFPAFVDELLPLLDAAITSKTDGVEMRIWELDLPCCSLRLVYEDFPAGVSLESSTDDADDILRDLYKKLSSTYGDMN